VIRPVAIDNCESTYDLLHQRLERSVRATCRHARKECLSTSESGSNTCYASFRCSDCRAIWTDELLPAEYDALVADESIP
jgi:hypothetical protein